ncbi:MAG: prolipoprotein diacylglyceryl transferase [Nanoarchaeota archaeon]|nr:prolipoprotein diacylglyceryl transferase [Nanoarchaeota archaeon]
MVLPYIYYPEINLGFIKIYSFGLIVAIAFLAGLWFSLKEAKRRGVNRENVYSLVFYIIIGGIIGSRLLHIFLNWNVYSENLLSIFMLWEGGLTFYGGFIGALIAGFAYSRSKKLKFLKYVDILAPSIALGHAIGRIACIVGDGGHVGKLTSLPFGVIVNGELRHLTALYSFVNLVFLFGLLLYLRKKKFFTGFLFLFYICYYALTRFFIELLRTDPTIYGLTATQWIAIPLFFISLGVIIKKW